MARSRREEKVAIEWPPADLGRPGRPQAVLLEPLFPLRSVNHRCVRSGAYVW